MGKNKSKHQIKLFSSLNLRGIIIPNRIMISPMCQYSAKDAVPHDWHFVHLATRAVGGAGIVMTEAVAVEPAGRITPFDVGLWNNDQQTAFARIAGFIHDQGAVAGLQLAHAGYQVPFAERVRRETGIRTVAVGMISQPNQAEDIIASGRADLVAIGRLALWDPYWPHHAAKILRTNVDLPIQYERANIFNQSIHKV